MWSKLVYEDNRILLFSMPLLPWQQSRDHLNGLHPNDQNKAAAASGYSLTYGSNQPLFLHRSEFYIFSIICNWHYALVSISAHYFEKKPARSGVCKSRNPTRNTRNPPERPGTSPGTPGTPPGTPGTPPGTPETPPGTPRNPTRNALEYELEAMHVFLHKFTYFAVMGGLNSGWWVVTIFTFYLYCCSFQ
jgi:hypothetical protein